MSIQQRNCRKDVGRCLRKTTRQKSTACAEQHAFTCIQARSTDETCKQHEINKAQTDLGDGDGGGAAMRQLSVVQTNPSDDNRMRKAHASTWKTNNKTCKQQQTNKAQPELCRRWMETVGALARILVLQQNLTNPCSWRFFF